jgi:hypothetical protein
MAPRRELGVDQLRELLTELGRRLQAKGVQATIYIVGGAAIALEFDTRRVTADIDAVFHPPTTVLEVAHAMADELALPTNWLNNNAASFVPGDDHTAPILDVPGVSVSIASPEHLVAMKLASFRPGTDLTDLDLLFRHLHITTAEQAADLALEIYGEYSVVLPHRDELLLSAQIILDMAPSKRRPRTPRKNAGD